MTDVADEPVVLFLDVDGTLLPFQRRPDGPRSPAVTADTALAGSVNPLLDRLDPGHGPRLLALGCQLVWATSWTDEANEIISPRLGLPTLPTVPWSDGTDAAVTGRLHWKTRDLVSWAAGRAFVWVDDEITQADRVWVSARHPGDALLHRVEPNLGLTDADFTTVQRWLDLRTMLVVPIHELTGRVGQLLDQLCIELGFCLPPAEQHQLRHEPPLDADDFVNAVFVAEGLDPNPQGDLWRQVKDRVINRLPSIANAYRP